jgi:lysozyme family protein
MRLVSEIAREIVAREGGFVNDPADPGGATNFGVTLQTMRRLGLDLTRDGRVDLADLHALTREDAEKIFIEHYYERPKLNLLPHGLQASVFDMYVNAGANAVRILQRLLVEMGHQIAVDGIIGDATAQAANLASVVSPQYLVDAYGIARRNYYLRLADERPLSRKFARTQRGEKGGWIRRAEEFITPRYHLTEKEFQTRVQAWG